VKLLSLASKRLHKTIILNGRAKYKGLAEMRYSIANKRNTKHNLDLQQIVFRISLVCLQELLAPASNPGSALDINRFSNASLNGSEFSLRALNDRPLKPVTRADQPPDRD